MCVCLCRAACVLVCKVHANARCLGPWDQTGDDNPGGTLCGPAH